MGKKDYNRDSAGLGHPIAQLGSTLFEQTFIKEGREITEADATRRKPKGTMIMTESFGYFLPSNVHNGSESRAVWDSANI